MKVKELIEELSEFDSELEVVILDGFNGGGQPRQINLGPHTIKKPKKFINPTFPIPKEDRDMFQSYDTADFKDPNVLEWVEMGYGCY